MSSSCACCCQCACPSPVLIRVYSSSDEGIEYPAHSNVLKLSCEAFEAMFEAATSDEDLPKIPLLADSATMEMILPLAYRKSAAALRSREYGELLEGTRLAHRLGMPMVLDLLSVFLEDQFRAGFLGKNVRLTIWRQPSGPCHRAVPSCMSTGPAITRAKVFSSSGCCSRHC